jgi:seryl-tRNA synthetase
MNLTAYPRTIAKAEETVLAVQEEIAVVADQLACMDADIEKVITHDDTLKNEQQRKAYRIEAQRSEDYVSLQNALKNLKFKLAEQEIELNRIRNEFSVAKLEARLAIAQLEQAAA